MWLIIIVVLKEETSRRSKSSRRTIVLPEIGDRLVIGSQAADQPHHLDIAARLTFQAATGLHPIEITVDVKPQKNCRMIGGPTRLLGDHTLKPQSMQVERLDERIDHMDRVVLAYPILQAVR